uniref:FG-GAP repeat-containing protein n=1 Tax=Arcella intermedia TaxID=1963864 RepID=A0A6B2KYS3_9EUKA
MDIIWHKKLETNFYSTPLVTDLFGDGRKDIICVGLDYTFALAGDDGDITTGDWPIGVSQDSFIASPLLYDVDYDGYEDIILFTMKGLILFVSAEGDINTNSLQIPPTTVRKDWFNNELESSPKDKIEQVGGGRDKSKANEKKSDNSFLLFPQLHTRSKILSGSEESILRQKLWEHYAKKLTAEGLESLELFISSKPSINSSSTFSFAKKKGDPIDSSNMHIEVPGHILSPPILADIENDGNMELVIAVSFYFEGDIIEGEPNLDPHNYVASGIVVFDLTNWVLKWETLLDLTTDTETAHGYKGYLYGSPTVVDLDMDGKLEIIIGTASGMIYVLNSNGTLNSNVAPMLMDVIYSGITAEDILGDGTIQLICTDASGTIATFSNNGQLIWENQFTGIVNHNPVVGDVNSDGVLDVVIATSHGIIYAYSGDTGSILLHFPKNLGDPVYAQPLLVHIPAKNDINENYFQIHILVHSISGLIMIVNPMDETIQSFDIGSGSFSMLIADDINHNGKLQIVASTTNGDIYLLGTDIPFHPLDTWTSQIKETNVVSLRRNVGIVISPITKNIQHISGKQFTIFFEILDNRKSQLVDQIGYKVQVLFGNILLGNKTFYKPGKYSILVSCPKHQETNYLVSSGTVKVVLTNPLSQVYSDSFHLSFNTNFHKMIKWILAVPFFGMCFVLYFIHKIQIEPLLPS